MRNNKRISVSSGSIVNLDTENGLIGVSDALGTITNYNVMPSSLFDADGNQILIDELRLGDQVVINETGYLVMMKVWRIA
ncbi:MAG: hypothetical protein VR67_11590 [Peptococcaceae bacterium BRH_c8a]|nr:MAG: hypothetical protein VR67_11590 [Peptococcaceae bacterium BRH_c8a]